MVDKTISKKATNKFIKMGSRSFLSQFGFCIAFVYHFLALVIFALADIKPLFFFNVGSVILYITLIFINKRYANKNWPFMLEFIEVLIHQILATLLLGPEPAFYILILPIGILGMMILDHSFTSSIGIGFTSTLFFIILYVTSPYYSVNYYMNVSLMTAIKYTNVIGGILVVFVWLFAFTVRVTNVSDHLAFLVSEKEREINEKNQKVSTIQKHMIYSLANLVENRDQDTGEHIFRTSRYVEMISKEALKRGIYTDEINEKFISDITHAAPMHDIGKITIDDDILKKPGKLTEEEFEIMKSHTVAGAKIVADILKVTDDKAYITMAVDVAYGHHEKWNGKGYPQGLAGEQIPLSSRIMAIADVFDALVSPRCYKQAMSFEKAFSIIEEERGEHFDPQLVDIFLSIKDQIRE